MTHTVFTTRKFLLANKCNIFWRINLDQQYSMWNHFAYEYLFGSCEQVKFLRVISFIFIITHQGEYACLKNMLVSNSASLKMCASPKLNLDLQ